MTPTPPRNDDDRRWIAGRVDRASRVVAVALLAASAWHGARLSTAERPWVVGLVFFGAALVVWAVAAAVQHRLLLRGQLRTEVPRGNEAAVLALSAHHVALAIVTSHALYGLTLADLPPAAAFAGLGILTWGFFVMLFRTLTSYDDAQEIVGENHASALSYAGVSIALAMIIGHALDGPFVGWRRSLDGTAHALAWATALYPVRQLVVQGVLLGGAVRLRGHELDRAIAQRRSVPVAAIEAGAYVLTATLVMGLA